MYFYSFRHETFVFRQRQRFKTNAVSQSDVEGPELKKKRMEVQKRPLLGGSGCRLLFPCSYRTKDKESAVPRNSNKNEGEKTRAQKWGCHFFFYS